MEVRVGVVGGGGGNSCGVCAVRQGSGGGVEGGRGGSIDQCTCLHGL